MARAAYIEVDRLVDYDANQVTITWLEPDGTAAVLERLIPRHETPTQFLVAVEHQVRDGTANGERRWRELERALQDFGTALALAAAFRKPWR